MPSHQQHQPKSPPTHINATNSGILIFAGITVLASVCVSFIACRYYKSKNNGNSAARNNNTDEEDIDENDNSFVKGGGLLLTEENNDGRSSGKQFSIPDLHIVDPVNNDISSDLSLLCKTDGKTLTTDNNGTGYKRKWFFWKKKAGEGGRDLLDNKLTTPKIVVKENSLKKVICKEKSLRRKFDTNKTYTLTVLQTAKRFDDYGIEITTPETYV